MSATEPAPPAPGAPGPAGAAPHVFRERLWPGPLGIVLVLALAGTFAIVFVPVDTVLALVVGSLVLLGAVLVVVLGTPRVAVERHELVAGSAHIPVRLLAAPRPLDRDQVRVAMGPGLDARAYVCLRAWVGSAVRVEVRDPQDPTPYWIVSTRHPDALVAALLRAGAAPS